jgi:hypothetical protein
LLNNSNVFNAIFLLCQLYEYRLILTRQIP